MGPLWAPALLAGSSVGLAVAAVGARADRAVRARVEHLAGDPPSGAQRSGVLLALGRSRLGAAVGGPRLADRLAQSGARWSPERMAGAKLLALGAAGFASLLALVAWPPGALAAIAVVPAILRAPDIVTARLAARRRQEIDRHVLDFVELLVAATEAGLPPAAAVRRASGLVVGPLGQELERVGREIALGLGWRTALEQVSARTQAIAFGRLVSALGRAHRLGTSARASLRAVADELRAERRARAEELARRAPVKMLFPLVFLILPAFLLLTVGPVLVATIRSLH